MQVTLTQLLLQGLNLDVSEGRVVRIRARLKISRTSPLLTLAFPFLALHDRHSATAHARRRPMTKERRNTTATHLALAFALLGHRAPSATRRLALNTGSVGGPS